MRGEFVSSIAMVIKMRYEFCSVFMIQVGQTRCYQYTFGVISNITSLFTRDIITEVVNFKHYSGRILPLYSQHFLDTDDMHILSIYFRFVYGYSYTKYPL